jgi:hypothetical protein
VGCFVMMVKDEMIAKDKPTKLAVVAQSEFGKIR